jgi:alkylation response protein AidB-like acyl-CoA dehydrogenase
MNFEFAEEENTVAELARQVLEDRVTNEHLKEMESQGAETDCELMKSLAEAGLLGVAIAEEHGGMDLGYVALCRLLQEVGRTVAPIPVHASLVLGGLPLAEFGSAEERSHYLPGIATGDLVVTAALTELDSSDPLRPSTHAERSGAGFRITGHKSMVPAAQTSERILVPATLGSGEVALFWIDPAGKGVQIESQQTSDRAPHAYLQLDGVEVSQADALGGLEGGSERLRWLVERATIARCAMQLGVIERALEMTASYGAERMQFGRPIGSFQAFHQRAADAYIQVQGVRLATWEAAWRLGQGLDATDAVAVAKYWAAEGGQFTAYACQHLHGGIGIDLDYPLHRYFLWASQIEHELGSAPLQLQILGDRIAEQGVVEYS